MSEWVFAQTDPSQQLAKLHFYSVKKGEAEITIRVREFVTPKDPTMKFFAEAETPIHTGATPYTACGWGDTLFTALAECVREINRFTP